jgi:hypothetical protein
VLTVEHFYLFGLNLTRPKPRHNNTENTEISQEGHCSPKICDYIGLMYSLWGRDS